MGINHFESENTVPHIEEIDDKMSTTQIDDKVSSSYWYNNIMPYLLTLQCPTDMTPSKERTLKL